MKYVDMQKKYLGMIEELNLDSEQLTNDPDIAQKQMEVTNQVMFELARMKKIPKYLEEAVTKGQVLDFAAIGEELGRTVYQINLLSGVEHRSRADGTVYKILQDGVAEIDCYIYPQRITQENAENYEFELSEDALEIMPYGIAAHLLKSDVSADYGKVYADTYEKMLARLDPRYQMTSITLEGGIDI